MIPHQIHIINGDHEPPLPFVIVDRMGLHVDLTGIGELWDPTVAEIIWGLRDNDRRPYGVVKLKNGTGRRFGNANLMLPYLRAWKVRKAEEDAKHAANVKAAADAAIAAAAEAAKRDNADALKRRLAAMPPVELLEAPIGA